MQKWEIVIFMDGKPDYSKTMYFESQFMAINYANLWCDEKGGNGFKARKIGESI